MKESKKKKKKSNTKIKREIAKNTQKKKQQNYTHKQRFEELLIGLCKRGHIGAHLVDNGTQRGAIRCHKLGAIALVGRLDDDRLVVEKLVLRAQSPSKSVARPPHTENRRKHSRGAQA